MANISNLNSNESIATGFVRPKVTALFFDKLWVPESLLRTSYEFFIPEQILIHEDEELIIDDWYNSRAGILYRRCQHSNVGGFVNPVCLYKQMLKQNSDLSFADFLVSYPIYFSNENEYKYSINRNTAIMASAECFCRKYGTYIAPVYHGLTKFEREVHEFTHHCFYNNKLFKYEAHDAISNQDAISISIENFPSIREDELSWEQVIDIRNDKKRIKQIKRFTEWSKRTLSGKTPDEINDILELELDEYKNTLKECGIKSTIGCFSTVVSGASSIASIISQPDWPLLPLISIATLSIDFGINTYFTNMKNRNNPIAFLYDIEEDNL